MYTWTVEPVRYYSTLLVLTNENSSKITLMNRIDQSQLIFLGIFTRSRTWTWTLITACWPRPFPSGRGRGKKKIFCPFDELGCKFGHNETIQDGHTANDKSEFIQKEIKELKKLIQEGITDHHNEEFHTSTPKKPDECNKCLDTSKCVDCMVKHMLGTHMIARALFDYWPRQAAKTLKGNTGTNSDTVASN